MLTDTHCHLDDEALQKDLDGVIARAREAGVNRMITIGSDLASSCRAVEIATAHPEIWAAVGVHPHDAARAPARYMVEIKKLAAHPRVVAIGEIGLDYHYDFSPRETQQQVFRDQLFLARELGLPVVVHTREAGKDTLDILERAPGEGVIHCYSGDWPAARALLDAGYYISLAGMVTFAKSAGLRVVAANVPDERLLIETDAPYLAPVPKRGKRNEPAFLVYTAASVAEIKGMSIEVLATLTSANADRLFGLKEE